MTSSRKIWAAPPSLCDGRSAQILAGVVAIVLAVAVIAGPAMAPAGAAVRQGDPPVTAPASVPAGDGSGPYLTGRTEPSMTQRIVDSLIWVWLLAVLVGAPAIWFWTGRRSRSRPPAEGPPTPN